MKNIKQTEMRKMKKPEGYPKYTKKITLTIQSNNKERLDNEVIELMNWIKKKLEQQLENTKVEDYVWINTSSEEM